MSAPEVVSALAPLSTIAQVELNPQCLKIIGILSYFAVQAGADKVYAVEASSMAAKIEKLLKATDSKNLYLKNKIQVVPCKGLALPTSPPVDC